ncbi:MAG: creatininase family protein [Proteobacteria bacterium]|nr:creatininase family protein [Pseudomonadota bacterium]
MKDQIYWEQLRSPQLKSLADVNAIVVVPVGSIEQHGPHLPVKVDALLATEVARRAALKVQTHQPILVTPTVWCGLAEHHMDFCGTLTLDFETFHALLRNLCRSIRHHGFRRIFLLNGHGGNIAALNVICSELVRELEGLRVVSGTYWTLPEVAEKFAEILEVQQNVRHAGEAETSMMLVLEPELVDQSILNQADGTPEIPFYGSGVSRWVSFKEVSANGVIGSPSVATAAKGELLLEVASEGIAGVLQDPELWQNIIK